jgi:hypothetical protein
MLDYMRKGDLLNFCYRQGRPQFNASSLLTVNFRQPSHEFTFNVGIELLF